MILARSIAPTRSSFKRSGFTPSRTWFAGTSLLARVALQTCTQTIVSSFLSSTTRYGYAVATSHPKPIRLKRSSVAIVARIRGDKRRPHQWRPTWRNLNLPDNGWTTALLPANRAHRLILRNDGRRASGKPWIRNAPTLSPCQKSIKKDPFGKSMNTTPESAVARTISDTTSRLNSSCSGRA